MIVLTGTFEDETLAVKAVKEGAQDYLFKDQVDGSLVVRSIHYAIEKCMNRSVNVSLQGTNRHFKPEREQLCN